MPETAPLSTFRLAMVCLLPCNVLLNGAGLVPMGVQLV